VRRDDRRREARHSWSKEQVLAFAAEEVRVGRLATVPARGDITVGDG
jgi:hypothetical protein